MIETLREDLKRICDDHDDLKLQFLLQEWSTDFLRFFRSQINYNITRNSYVLNTSVYKGKRSCAFSIVDPDMHRLKDRLDEARAILEQLPEDPDFVDIEDNLETVDEQEKPDNIHEVSLPAKIDLLEKIAQAVGPAGFRIYGTFICNKVRNIYINSNGVDKTSFNSPVMLELKAVSDGNEVTVMESFGGEDLTHFDPDGFTQRLKAKVDIARHEVVDVDPGEYTVILSPRVIGEFFMYMSFFMSARALDNNISFFEGKVGEKVFPEHITLIDDPHHPQVIGYPYNGEGHIYRPTVLIENGVFRNFLVSNYYGRKLKMDKNGASGECLTLSPGEDSLEDLIGSVKKGLFISSLHYMNFINPKETSVTGLTRDGTFLIEDGKMTRVVNNLRYTQRISEIIQRITRLENQGYAVPFSDNYGNFDISSFTMPHVRVDGFKISSSTKTV